MKHNYNIITEKQSKQTYLKKQTMKQILLDEQEESEKHKICGRAAETQLKIL